jgi:hypothetical protein
MVLGLVYGGMVRALFLGPLASNGAAIGVMSFSFLFIFPLVLGIVTGYREQRSRQTSVARAVLLPWLPTITVLVGSIVVGWEGLICVAMALPVFLVMASAGGFVGRALGRALWTRAHPQGRLAVAILAMPLLFGSMEGFLPVPEDLREVHTSIDIAASPEVVWRNIERVPAIQPTERRTTLLNRIGFPPPIEATLSYEGSGAVRHATFAGGVLFVETVHTWEPWERLEFSIRADSERIPAATLDEHVTIGGEYFDVLDGRYGIEQLDAGLVRLHLSSTHRLSTRINPYAAMWSDFIMRDIQDTILLVIKQRSEAASHLVASSPSS